MDGGVRGDQEGGGGAFKFNFGGDSAPSVVQAKEMQPAAAAAAAVKMSELCPSDNSFRFNFQSEEDVAPHSG